MPLYLVTGGAGFIGSHLVDALHAHGHAVRVLDDLSTGKRENLPDGIDFRHADVGDDAAVLAAAEDAAGVFHLAAIASVARGNEDWLGTHRVNLGGTIAVLEAARRRGGLPVVYASSAAIYGDTAGEIAGEDRRPAPLTAYGADKYGSELHAAVGWGVHGVPSAGLRFFNVYGPRQDPSSPYSGVISIFADRIRRGLGLTLHGDGAQMRDFVFVTDVVAHLQAAMTLLGTQPGAHVANVCTGRGVSIRELADTIAEIGARDPDLTQGPARAGDIRVSVGDGRRATELLGLRAQVTLRDGLSVLLSPA